MPWSEVPALLPTLGESSAALALRFLILTAARTGEVIGARWDEIDFDGQLWTIPAVRMKAQREHRVPFSKEALELLEQVRGRDDEFIFPGQKRGTGLSNMSMTAALRRLGRSDITVHGFRSSFRDWAEERGGLPREIAEMCLAHEVGNAVERAYRRSDMLEKRRALIGRWARFCTSVAADVITLAARI